jgi:hypothetical protein
VFGQLDKNKDNKLTEQELKAFFSRQGRPMPPGLMQDEDKDSDGFISWDEFGGPKGAAPPTKDDL